jgi:hypothetical protein
VKETAPAANAGPYVTAPHSQRRVRCRPHRHAMLPTRNSPGRVYEDENTLNAGKRVVHVGCALMSALLHAGLGASPKRAQRSNPAPSQHKNETLDTSADG